ncbi:MAG: anaerobic ribonucleoside-triphosphate reductase activating protein [Anaerohalosphaeraceae bacterium]
MKFGGFQPLTLSDFPGRTAAVLFVQGCNFRCPFCHNGRLLERDAEDVFDEQTAVALLAERRKILDGIVLSGGEPTLQADLPDFIRELRRMGFQVKLDTNGSQSRMLESVLEEGLLDYAAMDIKAPPCKYPLLTGGVYPREEIERSIELIVHSGIAAEFRTTFVPGLLTSEDLEQIRRSLPAGAVYKIQKFAAESALEASLRKPSELIEETL